MIKISVARRYAVALFDLARESDSVDQVGAELADFAEAVKADHGLKAFFFGRAFAPRQKNTLISQAMEGKVSPLTLQFVRVLVDKQRENYIDGIITEYRKSVDRYRGVEEIEAVTAVALSDAEAQDLASKLSGVLKKQVRLARTVRPELLGGLVLKIGDRRVDGSIRGRLDRLRERMAVQTAAIASGATVKE